MFNKVSVERMDAFSVLAIDFDFKGNVDECITLKGGNLQGVIALLRRFQLRIGLLRRVVKVQVDRQQQVGKALECEDHDEESSRLGIHEIDIAAVSLVMI